MLIDCPKCRRKIDSNNVNVLKNVAFCYWCSEGFKLDELIDEDVRISSESMPIGTWYIENPNSVTIGGTTRSRGAFIIIPFAALWAGGSMSAIYGDQITSGQFDIMQSLVGIPFVLGSIFLISYALMLVAGKIEVEICEQSRLFIGVGDFGWTRYFPLSSVTRIYSQHSSQSNFPFTNPESIIIQADKRYELRPNFDSKHHDFILKALRHEFSKRMSST